MAKPIPTLQNPPNCHYIENTGETKLGRTDAALGCYFGARLLGPVDLGSEQRGLSYDLCSSKLLELDYRSYFSLKSPFDTGRLARTCSRGRITRDL